MKYIFGYHKEQQQYKSDKNNNGAWHKWKLVYHSFWGKKCVVLNVVIYVIISLIGFIHSVYDQKPVYIAK